MMPYREKLSGTDANGSGLTSLATYPTLTTIHTVPPNEVHTIWLTIVNTNGAAAVEVLGDVGENADTFNESIPVETAQQFGPMTLHGSTSGTTLALSALANGTSIKVFGSVERYRSVR